MHKGLLFKELAEHIGVTEDTVINWEARDIRPCRKHMERIKHFLRGPDGLSAPGKIRLGSQKPNKRLAFGAPRLLPPANSDRLGPKGFVREGCHGKRQGQGSTTESGCIISLTNEQSVRQSLAAE